MSNYIKIFALSGLTVFFVIGLITPYQAAAQYFAPQQNQFQYQNQQQFHVQHPGQFQTNEQLRQSLIAQIRVLIAQLERLGVPVFPGVPSVPTFPNIYNVEVETLSATNISGHRAWLWGEVDLNATPSATVWFRYGLDRNLLQTSRFGQITTRTTNRFRAELSNLQEDRQYFYQALARDPAGSVSFGAVRSFIADERFDDDDNFDGDEPDVTTNRARDIRDTSAELRGEVDMNDFRNGLVFFVYGEDENDIEDVEDEDEFDDIRQSGDDLRKIIVDRDLDGAEDYKARVGSLDRDTEHFFRICVEFEDDDDDQRIVCGSIDDFFTGDDHDNDDDFDGDEPDVTTDSATNITDDSAGLRGDVDMNDFDDGLVFFAYGEDENDVEGVEDEDRFDDIDEQGDDLQLIIADSSLDGSRDYTLRVIGLDDDTEYFFRICVEFEDDDGDEIITCGTVEDFTTDN